LINDAINRDSSMYFLDDNGRIDTVWDSGDAARESALLNRSPYMTQAFSALALFDLFLACLAPPGIPGAPDWLMDAAQGLAIFIWLTYCDHCAIRLQHM